ncbi:MAG: sigma 54-interacting transcriptional regulator [Bacteroidetes bacterium]|nr:sigma 54-interacting transcriptional regulator [Bacteroidota bacterium]
MSNLASDFTIKWGNTEWEVNPTEIKIESSVLDVFKNEKSDRIIKVFEALYKSYYDNNSRFLSKKNIESTIKSYQASGQSDTVYKLMDKSLPWDLHGVLNKQLHDNSITEQEFKEILKTILNKNWILGWHWRAALSILHKWRSLSKDEKLVLQISHFRKWEILLCFSVKERYLIEYDNISFIPLKEKQLLRAPIFSLSYRLREWDAYRMFFSDEKILEKVNKKTSVLATRTKKPRPDYELANIIGRHDCYYIVENVTHDASNANHYKWQIRSFIEFEPEKAIINEAIYGKEQYFFQPDDLINIPSFGKENKGIPQLLSSDNYCHAILEMNEILNDPTVKSLLLIAPPGSGKEELSKLAYYCRDNLTFSDNFVATTLAGLSGLEASKLLFAFNHDETDLSNYKPNDKDGLILKALGGALFIDEIDKTEDSVRNLLLRVLESGEFTVPESSMVIKIPKDKIPLYIFSGSKSKKEMYKLNPPDFWTRVSHTREVEHPLNISDPKIKKLVIKDYVWMFWCRHINDFMKLKGIKKECFDKLSEPINDFNKVLNIFLLKEEVINFVSEVLSKELMKRGKCNLYSIRTLRSIVGSAVYKFIEILMYAKSKDESIEEFKASCPDNVSISFKTWFDKLEGIIKEGAECNNNTKCSHRSEKSCDFGERIKEDFIKSLSEAVSLAHDNK